MTCATQIGRSLVARQTGTRSSTITGRIGAEIERYVVWLAGQGYRPRTVLHRVPLLVAFAEFARARGARCVADLPAHVEAFVADRVEHRQALRRSSAPRQEPSKEFRGPIEQMLELVVPGFQGSGRRHHDLPFAESVPGFFEYLSCERGLRLASIRLYQHHLDRFEALRPPPGTSAGRSERRVGVQLIPWSGVLAFT